MCNLAISFSGKRAENFVGVQIVFYFKRDERAFLAKSDDFSLWSDFLDILEICWNILKYFEIM